MTLQNFEKYIDTTILGRGCDYFENGNVDELEKIEAGYWIAQVYGTEIYTVSVKLADNQVIAWECNCPYNYGPVCKHVVAVFYAIKEALASKKPEIKKKQKREKTKKKSRVELIFQKVTKEDLQGFIVDQFGNDYRFKNSFIAYFAELLDEDDDRKYRNIFRNIYKAAADRHGFIDYRAARGLTSQLYQLIVKAERLLDDGNLTESLSICKTLIEEIPGILQNMDDSDGGAGDIIYGAFNNLHEIISKSPPLLKDELFNYALGEYQKEKYSDFGFEDTFLDLFPELVTTEEQERIFFELIDNLIKSEKKSGYSEYGVTRLLTTKISYLQSNNRKEEAWKIMMDNIGYSRFREMIVNEYIGHKKFAEAKKLLNEGLALEEKDTRYGIVLNWQMKVLEIAEIENNVEEIRKWSEKLFYKNSFGMK
ncbi:MAG: SWIM zinc finger domain-containing protein [Calditrichia bacterium]